MTEQTKKEISFLEGSVFGALIRFAVPVLGALILQAAYGAVDLIVVGQFGDAASISAVGPVKRLSFQMEQPNGKAKQQ